jgi:indole-3-glycerol phosphate synthase
MSVLERIVASTRAEVERRRRTVPTDVLERRLPGTGPRRFAPALAGPEIAVIAEHKRRSPSAGSLRDGSSVTEVVSAYERGGAAALSVLTEGPHFDGSLADLEEARRASTLPVLRKDFIVDDYQLAESAVADADAVLLIVAALGSAQLRALRARAGELGLDVLVEVHDARELDVALQLDPEAIGINNRDLSDFSVDPARTFELLEEVPEGRLVVSESGIGDRGQLEELQRAGVAAVLVGESLMRAADIEAACRALTGRAGPEL